MMGEESAALCLTMGEPCGIGGELTLKSWMARTRAGVPTFFVVDDPERLERESRALGLSVPIEEIKKPPVAPEVFHWALPVLNLHASPQKEGTQLESAAAVLESVRRSVAFALTGEAAGVVTNPVNKSRIAHAGIGFRGHTEFIAELCGVPGRTVMMLACEKLRVVPASVHVPLREVPGLLNREWLEYVGRVVDEHLRRSLGISEPVLMFAGLNPHAGEDGVLGEEEKRIIAPAVAALQASGIDARGPAAADSLFHAEALRSFDAAICMYHDQALTPFKCIAFHDGVNVTLGLPIVRTSPDHGTAEQIAGKGLAREDSLIAALRMAALLHQRKCLESRSP